MDSQIDTPKQKGERQDPPAVDGIDLEKLLKNAKWAESLRDSPTAIPELLRTVLTSLCQLHKSGVIHLDVTAANIVITRSDETSASMEVKLNHTKTVQSVGALKGMFRYSGGELENFTIAPPERFLHNAVDQKADIWAFGMLLYEIYTDNILDSFPFMKDANEIDDLAWEGDLKPVKPLPDHCPPPAKHMCELCLNQDPSKRPTAAELLKSVETWLRSARIAA